METTETVLSSIDPGPVMAGEAQAAEVALATLFDLPLAIGAESVRFLGRRYQAEVAHMGRLLACRSMPELAVEQMRYLAGAAYDCCDEAGALITRTQATLAPVVPLPLAD